MSPRLSVVVRAGLPAAAVFLLVLTVGAHASGNAWDAPLRWIAALFGSEPALITAGYARGGISTPSVLAWGIATTAFVSTVYAWLFLKFASSRPAGSATRLALGAAYGLALGAFMYWLGIWPDYVMAARVRLIPGTFFAASLTFGVVISLSVRRAGSAQSESAAKIFTL